MVLLTLVTVGCSSDDSSDSSTSASVTVAPADSGSSTSKPAATSSATTIALPPDETSDIPTPLPPGTGDIPVYTPPETSDIPVYISVTVGTDDSPTRVENVPLGTPVTIDIVDIDNPDEYHLEGYELGIGEVMGPGQTATFTFVADQIGDFALESATLGVVLLTLHVG